MLLHTLIPPWLHPALSESIYILQNHPSASVLARTRTLTLLICKIFFPMDLPASSVLVQVVQLMEAWRRNAPLSASLPLLTSRINVKWPSAFGASGHTSARESGRYESKF